MLLEKFITSSITFVQAANINDKNCSLFTVLTAMHRKLKKNQKGDITQHHVAI